MPVSVNVRFIPEKFGFGCVLTHIIRCGSYGLAKHDLTPDDVYVYDVLSTTYLTALCSALVNDFQQHNSAISISATVNN